MIQKVLISLYGLFIGLGLGYFIFIYLAEEPVTLPNNIHIGTTPKNVIGFLPFWLAGKAVTDYSKEITTLTYFGLTVDKDGSILKLNSPTEEEPGWSALKSGKMDNFFDNARKNNINLSLLVFKGNPDTINQLITEPEQSATRLISDVAPIMKQHGFNDLNIDIENVQEASPDAQLKFTRFIKTIRQQVDAQKLGTITIDVGPTDLIKRRTIDPVEVSKYVDYVVLMGYDYHYTGSSIAGPVAPLMGAGTVSEYDVDTAVQKALAIMPAKKILLGIPIYGYEWETLGNVPRSATIAYTGVIASHQRVQNLINSCASCSAEFDPVDHESHLIYPDDSLPIYHQIFFPDTQATQDKINYATAHKLGGVAVWALGYEGTNILSPLINYR